SERVAGSFFFSSRRRHTRSKRDWSSDVCSSDLTLDFRLSDQQLEFQAKVHAFARDVIRPVAPEYDRSQKTPWDVIKKAAEVDLRSEERRVGKECRARQAPEESKEENGDESGQKV